jgi:hypothetical protein
MEVYGPRWASQSSKLLHGGLAPSWVGSTPIRLCLGFMPPHTIEGECLRVSDTT